ncbi:MAG TPA: peptide ABC transporter substrate-binding protein [Thermomicrobiales bacterium]|jgi:oligopeptide transport system substrate-binding protein|nr:peptide ABC transporter substrate-binding protein [Thermomicrobiales bacterium]
MNQLFRHWARLAALAAVFALIVPVMTTGTAAQDGGKVLRVHQITYPDVVDPQKSSFTSEIAILALAYEGLTRLDTSQQTVPGAAESWEYNDDATQITFHLRDGLKYSDGSPLTAENFRYAVERTCDPNTAGEYQSILFEIAGCEDFAGLALDADGNPREFTQEEYDAAKAKLGAKALDETTLQLDLTHPAPYYHTIASLWVFYPVKQEIATKDPDNWWKTAENHIGNGPFKVTGIAEDQQWTFEANDNYWQGRPKLDAIEYHYVEDSQVALEAYRTGDLDTVDLEPPQVAEVQADPDLSQAFVTYPTASTYNLGMNLTQEPFNDPKVREAFSYAVDRETLCNVIRSGDCTPTLSWIPAGIPGAIETDKFGFDPDKAKQALAESSYGSADKLPEIKLYYNSDVSGRGDQVEWVAGQFRDILGVEVSIEPTDGTTLTALRKDSTTFPQLLFVGGWIQDYPDAQNWLSVYWTCASTFSERVGYCNEDFDKLVSQGDTTIDPAERVKYYEQAGQILVDDVPGPFLYNESALFVVNPAVTGYTPTASEVEWPGYLSSIMTIDKTG